MLMDLEVRHLRLVAAVAELGSLTRAAIGCTSPSRRSATSSATSNRGWARRCFCASASGWC